MFAAFASILLTNSANAVANANGLNSATSSSKLTEVTTAEFQTQPRPKIAVVLGGGGLRGYAHVGVLKVLEEEHIPIDLVVGTSMGAIIGGVYCAGTPLSALERDAGKPFVRTYYKERILPEVLRSFIDISLGRSPEGLVEGKRLVKDTHKYFGGDFDVSDCKIPFAAVAVDLTDGKAHALTSGNFGKVLQATTAIPILRKPVRIGDSVYVDGGIASNVPVQEARDLGADFVIAVNVDHTLKHTDSDYFKTKISAVLDRSLDIMLSKIDRDAGKDADAYICPDVDGIGLLSKEVQESKRAIIAGENAARAIMPEIRKKLAAAGVAPATCER